MSGAYNFDCGTALICALPGLTVGEPYRFQVIAVNAIGESTASAASDPYTVDYLPAAPSVTAAPTDAELAPAGGSVTVSWSAVPDPNPGTPIVGYSVEFNGATRDVSRSTTSTTFNGLPTATEFSVRVYARNSAQVTSTSDWVRSAPRTVTTVGPPTAPGQSPSAASGASGTITVSWDQFGANGGGAVTYSVRRTETGSSAPTSCSAPTATGVTSPWTDSGLSDGTRYTYYIYASNGRYCSVASTGEAESKSPPGQATGSAALVARGGTGQLEIQAANLSASGIVDHFEYSPNRADVTTVSDGQWLTSAANTAVYGAPQTFYFRACRDASATYCGEWSAPATATPLNARSIIESCTAPTADLPGLGRVLAPLAGGAQTVSHEASFNRPLIGELPNWSAFAPYTDGGSLPLGTTGVRIKTTVSAGGDPWTDPGYAEAVCTAP